MDAAMNAFTKLIADITVHIGGIAHFDEPTHILQYQAVRIDIDHIIALVLDLQHLFDTSAEWPDIVHDENIVRANVTLRQFQ